MATTFDVFYLGTFAELDPVEGNNTSENAYDLVGQTLGSAADPLSGNVVSMSQYGSNSGYYYINNNAGNHQFQIEGGAAVTFDGLVDYNATITYTDGTTANITAVVFQATDGQTFLAPEYTNNSDQSALEAKAIQSLTLNGVYKAGDNLTASRADGDYVVTDGEVDGSEAGEDMRTGYTDAEGDQVTDDGNVIDAAGGNDTIYAGEGSDTLEAGEGDDFLVAGGGDDVVDMGAGADVASGGMGDDSLSGAAGNDTLQGESGSDTVLGGAGNDWISASDGFDVVSGGAGDDIIYAGSDADTVSGGDGRDTIYAESGDDLVEGGGGGDFISAGIGNDTIYGDADSNTEWQIHASWNAYYLGTAGDLDGDESAGYTNNAASILGSYGAAADPLSGHIVRVDINDLDGDGGVDENDEMAVGATSEMSIDGVQQVMDSNASYNATVTFEDGSTGSFTAVVFQTVDGKFFLAPEYTNNADMELLSSKPIQAISLDSVYSDNNYLVADRWDDIDPEAGGDDTIYADNGDDVVFGEAGNDTIFGGGGSDTLDGGAGDDKLLGGSGDDVFVVSGGNDTIGDFNTGNTGALNDGDSSNNDFVDLSGHYDSMHELHADMADDGVLNQSNTLDAKGNAVDYSDNTQFGDGSLSFIGDVQLTADNTGVVCFTTGTMILTPQGERPIESLKPGDMVTTMDNGPQPIVWIGSTSLSGHQLRAQPKLRPIHINAGVLGADRPLLVSPQHGVLLPGSDILVRATHLHRFVSGTRVALGKQELTYFHLMFERHQIVFSNGSPSESLYPGPMALQAMNAEARAEIDTLFPGVLGMSVRNKVAQLYGDTAREVLRKPGQDVA
ncbi:Hint domain-containing protein [Shimia sp.]|uniref:Hint domain-containing protein n=1 Tax=unclassified Shimia TaxID=2630038 RepID=UPI0025E18480|nr:Hint domain-containing protein [Shimia sp.]MCH2067492.1 Hint domain-containing protein [Shimia sp.]